MELTRDSVEFRADGGSAPGAAKVQEMARELVEERIK
jgi:hypothetical protein